MPTTKIVLSLSDSITFLSLYLNIHHQSLLLRYYIHTNACTQTRHKTFLLPLGVTAMNLLMWSSAYTHTHTHNIVFCVRGLKQKPLLYYSGRHTQKTWTRLTNQNIIVKKTGRHTWLNISMNYCGYCIDWKSHTAIRLSIGSAIHCLRCICFS